MRLVAVVTVKGKLFIIYYYFIIKIILCKSK